MDNRLRLIRACCNAVAPQLTRAAGPFIFGGLVVAERGKEDRDQRQHARLSAMLLPVARCAPCGGGTGPAPRPRSPDRTTHIRTIRKTRHRTHVSAANSGPKSSGSSSASAIRSILRPAGGLWCRLCLKSVRVPWRRPATAGGTGEVVLQARRAVGCALVPRRSHRREWLLVHASMLSHARSSRQSQRIAIHRCEPKPQLHQPLDQVGLHNRRSATDVRGEFGVRVAPRALLYVVAPEDMTQRMPEHVSWVCELPGRGSRVSLSTIRRVGRRPSIVALQCSMDAGRGRRSWFPSQTLPV